ncbi:MAG: methyltransferase domain-containing protein [Deltaproteobacteria bacterium]|nr:methyltransferase domain-containing protein [Deltaproteobacteria bacterium]
MDWRVKGAIQKLLGYVPGGERIHYVLQQRGGGLTDFTAECDMKIDDWSIMMGHLRSANVTIKGGTFLEMGTGWYPTFPLCLVLSGAAKVHTVDLNAYLKPEKTVALANRLESHVPLIARLSGQTEAEIDLRLYKVQAALRNGATIGDATEGAIDYRAPGDAAKTGLPNESVDVVFSNSVLEHVPGTVIEHCLVEALRILRPKGIVFHSVNCGDHYAYTDKAIDQLHYLQYSESAWQKWNNEFLYQNRLRANDFTAMAKAAGFAIEIDTSRAHPDRLRSLDTIQVDPHFARYTREQLAITSIDFVGRKPA